MDRPKLAALAAVVLFLTLCLVQRPVSASLHGSLSLLQVNANTSATRPQGLSKASVQVLHMPAGASSNVELSSVSCVDVHFCIAVGEFRPAVISQSYQGEQPVILRYNGKAWSLMRPPSVTEADLQGVDCLSLKYCVAVGESINTQEYASPLIETMRNDVWSVTSSPSPDIYPTNSSHLQSVSCVSIGNCTAVGTDFGGNYRVEYLPIRALLKKNPQPAGILYSWLRSFPPLSRQPLAVPLSPPHHSTRQCWSPFRAHIVCAWPPDSNEALWSGQVGLGPLSHTIQ